MSAYADTSFLVSLYALDANSDLAASRMKRARLPVLITSLGETEFANALCLCLFRKQLVPPQMKAARAMFNRDLQQGVFDLRALSRAMFDTAKRIAVRQTPRLGTRTLDVLHVACALELAAETIYTFDGRQTALARAEGLRVA